MKESPPASASKLNNKAVVLLQCGKYNEAIAIFKAAFNITAKVIARSPSVLAPKPVKHINLLWTKVCAADSPKTYCILDDKLCRETPSFVFKRALIMDESSETLSPTQEATMLLFNLAIASHILALTICKGRPRLLRMALTMYKRAGTFLRMGMDSNTCLDSTVAFYVVSLNNVGQIYHELGQYKASASCFTYVSHAVEKVYTEGLMNESEKNEIVLNITALRKSLLAPAA